VCCEVNTSAKWSKEKVQYVCDQFSMSTTDDEMSELQKQVNAVLSGKQNYIDEARIIYNNNGDIICRICNIFEMPPSSICAKCMNIRRKQNMTLRTFLNKLLNQSHRINKLYNLNLQFICEMLIQQKGRCFYSNVPLTFKRANGHYVREDWRISIERINEAGGYTQDNVVLIAGEFQSSSRKTIRDTLESYQWSIDKVMHLVQVNSNKL
jgi:hypothetical protein